MIASGPVSADRVLARLDDEALYRSEFADFLDVARGPGYRPATLGEARRLLRAFGRERALQRAGIERGYGAGGAAEAFAAIVEERTGTPPVGTGLPPGALDGPRRAVLHRRAQIQRRAVLEALLEESEWVLDPDALAEVVAPPAPGRPPRPPGLGDRPAAERG